MWIEKARIASSSGFCICGVESSGFSVVVLVRACVMTKYAVT